jgi:gamma-glutamyltranspeptidase / glutathione hydrolase
MQLDRRTLLAGLSAAAGLAVTGELAMPKSAMGYDRGGDFPHQGRSVAVAKNGIVATSHPLAAQAGVDILRAGGTAADAAIAANAMLGVVEPMSCGIGGDLFAICWDAKTKTLLGLNASGRSPQSLTRQYFLDRGLKQIPVAGPLSWSAPGCVDGWEVLSSRCGNKPLSDLLAASIEAAAHGFPVPQVIAAQWKGGEAGLCNWPDSVKTFLLDGRAPREGEMMTNRFLAESYRRIAKDGADAFYRGPIAQAIAAASKALGGFLTEKDLADHKSDWISPVSTTYRGYEVWELPPNGQGIAALQMLNVLELHDIKALGHNSADYLHLFLEAKKLAFADRAKFYADPDFARLPIDELISKKYGRRQNERIDRARAAEHVPPGDPKLQHGDTVYITAVDKDRNCCSLIQSNYYGFGSFVVPGDTGFAMQNRGCLFSLEEDHLNRLEPGKRPFHTIIPAMVTQRTADGTRRPWFCFGVMGGDMQPQGHVQVLVNLIDFGMNVQAAGDAPRVCHQGSATPTGLPADGSGMVLAEAGISEEAVEELRRRGHRVSRARGAFGGYQGILIDHEQNVLHGATEARKDGAAVAY